MKPSCTLEAKPGRLRLPQCSRRHAMRRNGDLRVAYRASGRASATSCTSRDWHSCCEVLFWRVPSTQGWIEAMTSLGQLIFFDQPGTGSVPTPSQRGRCRRWSSGPTASPRCSTTSEVAKRSSFAVERRCSRPRALFAATHPSRTAALVVLDGHADADGTPGTSSGTEN